MRDTSDIGNMRDALMAAIIDLAREHKEVVFLDADLSSCINSVPFQKEFPKRTHDGMICWFRSMLSYGSPVKPSCHAQKIAPSRCSAGTSHGFTRRNAAEQMISNGSIASMYIPLASKMGAPDDLTP